MGFDRTKKAHKSSESSDDRGKRPPGILSRGTPGTKGHGRESLSELLLDHSEDVVGIEDHIVLAIECELGS
jgi:hypothetical protein